MYESKVVMNIITINIYNLSKCDEIKYREVRWFYNHKNY